MTAPIFDELVDLLDERVDDMVEEIIARHTHEFPAWGAGARPELVEPSRQLARDSIHAEIEALRTDTLPDALAPADAEFTRAAARIGAPINNITWGYRAGHAAQWSRWLTLVDTHESGSARRLELLQRASQFFFAYADRMIEMVSELYTRERERLLRTREQRRFHLVTQLLDGNRVDSAALDYDLSGWHTGVVIWGPGSGDAMRATIRTYGARVLVVSATADTYWGWLGTREQPNEDPLAPLVERLGPDHARLATGEAHEGSAGFRRTHEQARDAHRVALTTTQPITRFADIALIALAVRDGQGARAFLASELRGIDGADTRTRRLRETLDAYLASGLNAAVTAHRLGVHEQTVANRLRTIEQRTGRAVTRRHAELAIALQLSRLLEKQAEQEATHRRDG